RYAVSVESGGDSLFRFCFCNSLLAWCNFLHGFCINLHGLSDRDKRQLYLLHLAASIIDQRPANQARQSGVVTWELNLNHVDLLLFVDVGVSFG
ncbi:MAG: hypothetical protein RL268_2709, partial [Pseudomonadota bacterium]